MAFERENFENASKETVLHLVGSPTDEFTFNLNVFYAGDFDVIKNNSFEHKFALIRPSDKKMSFISSLSEIVDFTSRKLKKDVLCKWFNYAEASVVIANEIKPCLTVPHLFCYEGAYLFRSLMAGLNIPIIGTPSEQIVMAIDKAMSRAVFMQAGIPVPRGQVLQRGERVDLDLVEFPCVVRPTTTENSVGVSLVKNEKDLPGALAKAFQYSSQVIADKFIAGREIRCSVIEKVHPNGEIELFATIPQEYNVRFGDIRTFEDKLCLNSEGLPTGKAPTRTSFMSVEKEPDLVRRIQEMAIKTHKAGQFKDFSIIDVRVDNEAKPWLLEVNLFTSFGSQSVLTTHAQSIGWNETQLFQTMAENNLRKM